jgi:hypothetical protein
MAAFLAGCPIYSNQDYRVCTGTTCYDCPDPNYSSMCVPWSCSTDSDCGNGYGCTGAGLCASTALFDSGSGDDASVQNDCSVNGCPSGQVCVLAGGVATCQTRSFGSDAGTSQDSTPPTYDAPSESSLPTDGSSEGATDGSSSPEASLPDAPSDGALTSEASDGALSSEASTGDGGTSPEASASIACNAGGDCSVGSYCVDGQCLSQGQLCSDGSQCAVAGDSCVDGFCVPTCSASVPCPAGFQCSFSLGVCNLNPSPCTGGSASSCLGGAVCVESHCVPPCSTDDGGAACPAGQVCINGGCLPDQKAVFTCHNDGSSGQLANSCDTSSVCLHHDCYTACDGDGGGCPASQCKQVTVHAGTYAVCATPATLGSECDLATGAACGSSKTCVNGFCR